MKSRVGRFDPPTPLVRHGARGYQARMSRSLMALVLVVGLGGFAAPAAAQVCGDADGNGSVSVVDGVQTLREAAGLESLCTAAACDVDGNGSVSVTDGVNVLRKAAGLTIVENCGGSVAGQPATVLGELHTLFEIGVAYATSSPVTACDNGVDGDVEVDTLEGETTTSFTTCQVGDVILYGDVTVGPDLLTFGFFEADTVPDEDFIADYDGELTLGTSGAGRSLRGSVDVTTESASTLVVTFNGAVVTNGILTGGSVTVDLADSDISDQFTSFTIAFDGSGFANVTATDGGGGTSNYRLEIATGNVTQ